ncbi:Wadjet anti-phage system protein JetD domain-containing protein [Shimazuella alba]|uniref:Wadjet protein JetD C-terminal domain-containing protein n=1 Tax=Shimazuella alba TaxID=2690964 RepID=A0A6I4VT91_9BACL|nr:DUF2220 family protein [Shimazuella alba]MXQ54969.1 hypothetical protein [Shimazuella alba]
MKQRILAWISQQKRKTFEIYNLQYELEKKYELKYNEFAATINQLVEEDLIESVKSSGKNHRVNSLYNKYKYKLKKTKMGQHEFEKLLLTYHPKIKLNHYSAHKDEFEKDKSYLDCINTFLKSTKIKHWLSVNERSYELFGDEKWLQKNGQKILKKIGLSFSDLKCEIEHEPFFYYQCPTWNTKDQVKVLIIENKDTFGSFKRLFKRGMTNFFKHTFDLLIYGEGRKIESSIKSIEDIEGMKTKHIQGFYFGDLDPVGINIYLSLKEIDIIQVFPFHELYEEMISRFTPKAKLRITNQVYSHKDVLDFLQYINSEYHEQVIGLLQNYYIPQESLNREILESFGSKGINNV